MQHIAEQKVFEGNRDNRENALAVLRRGLADEYKVRMAKLAAIEFQLSTFETRSPKRVRPNPFMPSELTRLALTPAQLYDFYSDNRTELDAILYPVAVDSFVSQVGEPDERALDTLFAAYKTKPYDPAKADPGFMNPHVMKVKWVTGDPSSPFFKTVAKTANALAAYPILSWTPQMPLADAIRLAAGPAVYDARLAQEYRLGNNALMQALGIEFPVGNGDLGGGIELPMGSYLAARDPAAVAGLVGCLARAGAGFDSILPSAPLIAAESMFTADGLVKNKDLIKEGVRAELRHRAPILGSIIAAGAGGSWAPLAEISVTRGEEKLLPLAVVRQSVADVIERQQASPWVTANILFLKKLMEDEKVMGDELQMKRLLERFGPDYAKASEGREKNRNLGLEVGETKKAFDKYEAETDPELKPLRDAYERYYQQINMIEGRDGVTGKKPWKDSDFPKTFFEGTENIGLASEPRPFAVRPWPPTLSLGNPTQLAMMMQTNRMGLANMDSGAKDEFNALTTRREPVKNATLDMISFAEKPFLVWRTMEQKSDSPHGVADIKDRVVAAWKKIEARDKKALPAAQKIAQSLLQGNADYRTALKLEAKSKDVKLIDLNGIAKLASFDSRSPDGLGGNYGPYKIQGDIKFPRDDTVPNLIAMNGLKEPIKIGVPDIDNVNAALFQDAQKANRGSTKYVQILTNQPRDTFYVAVLEGQPIAVGYERLARMLHMGANGQDSLIDRAQARRGEEFLTTSFIQQLRERFKVKVFDIGKGMDNEVGT